jgi:hypothetical protein
MNESEAVRSALGVVRREWWIVAIAVVAAVAIAALVGSSTATTTYTGTANMLIDSPNISRYKGLPLPDDVLRQSNGSAWRERFAKVAGVSPDAIAVGLRVSSAGNPANRLIITYTSVDKAEAQRVATAVAGEITSLAQAGAQVEIQSRQALVKLADDAAAEIGKLEAKQPGTAWQQADDAFKMWQIQQEGTIAARELAVLKSAYSLDGEPSVATNSGARSMGTNLLGAALVGLVVGLFVAAGREWWIARASSSPKD